MNRKLFVCSHANYYNAGAIHAGIPINDLIVGDLPNDASFQDPLSGYRALRCFAGFLFYCIVYLVASSETFAVPQEGRPGSR